MITANDLSMIRYWYDSYDRNFRCPFGGCWLKSKAYKKCREIFPELKKEGSENNYDPILKCPCLILGQEATKERAKLFIDGELP